MWAASKGNDSLVKLLASHGANVNAEDNGQRTSLKLAAKEGLYTTAELLIVHGAQVNVSGTTPLSPLMLAAINRHGSIVKLLIDHGAEVNGADENQWTPLKWTAVYGHEQVVELLISVGAFVNAMTNAKQTALMLAAENGRERIVRTLIKHGASVDAANDKRQTALVLAASEGHTEVVRALLNEGASIEIKDENEETAMMYAIVSKHQEVVRELISDEIGLSEAMTLMKIGLHKRRRDVATKKKARDEAKAEVKLTDIVQLCSKMHEAQTISERIYSRLVAAEKQISTLNQVMKEEADLRFKQLISKTHGFLIKHGDKHTVTRLVGSQVITGISRDIHRELDALLLQFNILSDEVEAQNWKKQLEEDTIVMKSLLKESLRNTNALENELQDPQVQKEALALLMFECENHASQYSGEEMALIHKIFQDVSSMSQMEIKSVPKWFVPPHEVEFNATSSFARGSYGSIHLGTWNGTAVAIKLAFSKDEKSREMFLNETEIWYKLQHPHIVTLFRACHVGNPFFVCDWASNGTLSDYLYRHENHFETWAKLHEAAMGLEYLHTKQKVVHGDLKCNNILIGSDGKAKLADFGLSFVVNNQQDEILASEQIGAINWKAPEVICGKSRGSFASDVYSFGMYIVEAVTGRVPWGMIPDVAVKHKTLREKVLPKQPLEMKDAQWDLVKRMCAWDPADRNSVSEGVKILLDLANEELNQKADAEWVEYLSSQPATEPEPKETTSMINSSFYRQTSV